MPSWERLQEGPEEPFTDDIDADILLSEGRPSHLSTLTTYGQTLRRFFRSGNRAWIVIFFATLLILVLLVPTILLVYTDRVSLSSSSSRNLHPNHLPIITSDEATTPFLESFDFDNTSEVSLRAFSTPEFSPIFDFLYDYLNLIESTDADVSNMTNSSISIEVTIYYEVLDIPSRIFLAHQFFPTYFYENKGKAGNRELVAKLVPYGHAQSITNPLTKQQKFICEHGKDECEGNLVHACAIRHTNWKDKESVDCLMTYIECMLEDTGKGQGILNTVANDIGMSCANLHPQIKWDEIYNCTQNSEGQIILRTFKQKSESVLKGNLKGSNTLPLVYVKGYGVLTQTEKDDFRQFILNRLEIH